MGTDIKELLTLAAKACGMDIFIDDNDVAWVGGDKYIWAPHLDDGDGARMEEKLSLSPRWGFDRVLSIQHGTSVGALESYTLYEDHNNDRQAARRWASFRAAAQVGRGMP